MSTPWPFRTVQSWADTSWILAALHPQGSAYKTSLVLKQKANRRGREPRGLYGFSPSCVRPNAGHEREMSQWAHRCSTRNTTTSEESPPCMARRRARLRCTRAAPGRSAVCTWQPASSSCGSEGGSTCQQGLGTGGGGGTSHHVRM